MLVFAAIGVFGAGMLAIAAGIPIKEFGFGNTLILSGVLAWCTSAIMVTLWVCVRDIKQALEKSPRPARAADAEPPATSNRPPPPEVPLGPSGWPESIPERTPAAAPPASPSPPADTPAPRRNLLFASNRKPRDAGSREIGPRDPTPASANSVSTIPASESLIPSAPAAGPLEQRQAAIADEPRPAPRRIEPPRTVRPVSTINPRDPVTAPPAPAPLPPPAPPPQPEPSSPPSPPREAELLAPPRSDANIAVSVLKSGVVDGMAYWLYSDGSIEAQMPEGMMRFTSIDELRAHLDKRA